jgi:thioredoxin 1
MKKTFFFSILIISISFASCNAVNPGSKVEKSSWNGDVSALSNALFKKLVFNYDINKEWKFEGSKPVIIDFYADWCPPCRKLSPLVEEIAKEYKGKIVVYKVDTDKEKELAQSLGITNLPTLLFIPAKGNPQVTLGLIPKETIVNKINGLLLIN